MQCKSKKAKRQAQAREQRRQMKLEKYRRKSRGTAHGPRPTRNQHEVAKRLLAGEVAMVGGTGWSFVEPFLTFQVKVLLGLAGMNCLGQTLFRDLALLKLIGYTTAQLREGFCQRGKAGKQK